MTQSNANPEFILSNIISLLKKGVTDRKHGFHCPIFSNIAENKNISSRVVVLRKFDWIDLVLNFHTDYRSKKIYEISKHPKTFFVFYDSKNKTQLRINTLSKIHYQNEITKKSWNLTNLSSRKCYLAIKAPSSKSHFSEDSLPTYLKGIDPSKKESENGYKNFAVIENKIKKIEWLYLSSSGHQRLLINFGKNSNKYQWLIP